MVIMKKILILAFTVLTTNACLAFGEEIICKPLKHAQVSSITDLNYHKARKTLIKAGWQPLQTKSFNDAATEASEDPDLSSGNGALFWEKGYVEIFGCAGTGLAPCSFMFKDMYNNQLKVTTAGEENIKEKAYARVTGFNFVCTQ